MTETFETATEGARVMRKPRFTVEELAGRGGHDAAFLGEDLPTPLPDPRAGETWLHYTHFSVLLDTDRRLPTLTVCDIDAASWINIKRAKEDIWSIDPRVGVDEQPDRTFYQKPDPKFDAKRNHFAFGHMVRRMDPNWGDQAAAEEAELDTLHMTNTAPQAERLNTGIWNDLEDVVLNEIKQASALRVVVLTGPLFSDSDPLLHDAIPIPRQFWKLVGWREGDRLAAVGWRQHQPPEVLKTELARLPFDTPKSAIWLTPIADLARETGLDLAPFEAADTFEDRTRRARSGGRESGGLSELAARLPRSASELLGRPVSTAG